MWIALSTKAVPGRGQFCPTWVLGEGREEFVELTKEIYRRHLESLPKTSIIWTDFGEAPWAGSSIYSRPADGTGSWCFCDRCKEAFRTWADLPADADLSDESIFNSYRKEWHDFRSELDGELAAIAREAANELDKRYMMYTWVAAKEFIAAMNGNLDLFFAGWPGQGGYQATRPRQVDTEAEFYREEMGMGRSRVMGQRFHFFPAREPAEDGFWTKWTVLSGSGYVEPKTWKRQIIRIVAGFGGGIDLQSAMRCAGGTLYWISEATRMLATYEDLFHEGERADHLAACDELGPSRTLVMRRGDERLVLLFNHTDRPISAVLQNRDLKPGLVAEVYGTDIATDEPAAMAIDVPAQDVVAVWVGMR